MKMFVKILKILYRLLTDGVQRDEENQQILALAQLWRC